MSPMIRPATGDDLALIVQIVRDAYSLYVPRIGREPAPMSADYAALVAAGETWVATDAHDEAIGVLVIRPQPPALLLENVAVSPPQQGRGVGYALMRFAEEHARDLGLDQIVLYTNARMTENLRYYPALGYLETERRHDEGFDRVFYRKQLGGREASSG